MKKYFYSILLIVLGSFSTSAQNLPVNDKTLSKTYPFINASINRISADKNFSSFFQKLLLLKRTGDKTISIVHIGDSHIQADYLTLVIRNELQQFFGNAGRGLVFPYQLAQSNAPPDISSASNADWEFNRLAHPEIPIAAGISGYCIRTSSSGAFIDFYLKSIDSSTPQSFNRLKFFLGNSTAISWMLQANNNNAPFLIKKEDADTSVFKEVTLDQSTDGFTLSSLPSDSLKEFYGVSLENSMPGIIYHTIGVNGATYDSYNSAPLFWQQLPALNADLYIISLGTNEAQKLGLDQNIFLQQMNLFLEKLKATSPGADVLITTPADDFYRRRRPNIMLKQISNLIVSYCNHHNIPLWDLYHITGGYGSAYKWLKRGMMNNDRVHFINDGYRIQGNIFISAFAKGYNSYASKH